jgi:hypothetical protein
MTAFTGSAFAGTGQGNDNAPGQAKKDQAAAAQAAPAPATATPAPATAQQQPSGHVPPGQAKKQQSTSASSSGSTQSSTQLGVKPASNTTKWTHCTTGGTPGATTCKSSDNGHTPQPNADASKRYGNGKTAAQIAVSRGGSGYQLTGPGNSQPHKVWVCGKKNNKSGGVDVHAVKSYANLSCTHTQTAAATTQSCGTTSTCSNTAAVAPVTPAASPVVQSSAPVTQGSPVTNSTGGVLGAQITLTPPQPARHGVLGAVTHLSGATLPFTGFPLWFAVVIALALILGGTALRRRGVVTQV